MPYILCVDDEPSLSTLVAQVLKMAGHEVNIAASGALALQSIAAREPDLVVLDWSMPDMDGLAVCRAIKENPFTSRIPVLMLTALASLDNKVAGFEAGADDYLAKPFETRELAARVTALLRLVRREGERNPSSGLPGGRAIEAAIQKRLDGGENFSVCYFDLDHFKPFADTFGFAAADQVIEGLGAILGDTAQAGEFAGHIGGDDFLLLCAPERAAGVAAEVARRYEWLVALVVGPEAAARGQFEGFDRAGERREFPLARVSSVLLPVSAQNWVSFSHLGEAAAQWKRKEKGEPQAS